MSYASVKTACLVGSIPTPVTVEADIQPGLPRFTLVGMPNRQVSEARVRVRSAIRASGLPFPKGRVVVNLLPADLVKRGTGFDLAIALALLIASKLLEPISENWAVFGELSISGQVRGYAELGRLLGVGQCLVPAGASYLLGEPTEMIEVGTLQRCVALVKAKEPMRKVIPSHQRTMEVPSSFLIDHIYGQEEAKRALTIALAGGHNILLSGPAGNGKSLLAAAAEELLPDLRPEDRAQLSMFGDIECPPFRQPGSTSSSSTLLGSVRGPGELAKAHAGILFLDELPEFSARSREALRIPLELGKVTISVEGNQNMMYLARCVVIAAMNLCPCGKLGDFLNKCTCTSGAIQAYQKRVSQALLDRFDLWISVNAVSAKEMKGAQGQGKILRQEITNAQVIQRERNPYQLLNRWLSKQNEEVLHKESGVEQLLGKAVDLLGLSQRGASRMLRVARTIADLDHSPMLREHHLSEALRYRHSLPVQ